MTEAQAKALGLRGAYRQSRFLLWGVIDGKSTQISMCANSSGVVWSLRHGDSASIQTSRGHLMVWPVKTFGIGRDDSIVYKCEVEARTVFGLVEKAVTCSDLKAVAEWVDEHRKLLSSEYWRD